MFAFFEFRRECQCSVAENANVHVVMPCFADGKRWPEGDKGGSDTPIASFVVRDNLCRNLGVAPTTFFWEKQAVDGGRIGALQVGIQIGSLVSKGECDRLEEGGCFRVFSEVVFREVYGTTC